MSDDIRTVTLGGQEWKIPHLTLRQNIALQPKFQQASKDVLVPGTLIAELGEAAIMNLADIAFTAISAGHPALTRETFDNLPIGFGELLQALGTIMEQSKLYPKAKPGTGEATA